MKKCQDCGREVRYGKEYCQHCSAAIFGKVRVRHEIHNDLVGILWNAWQR